MKYSLNLSGYRLANVWLDEAPPADFTALYSVTKFLETRKVVRAVRRIAAVEFIFAGPVARYALLGAELAEQSRNGVEVVAPVNPSGGVYASSLASEIDDVRFGMPEEYVEGVLRGTQKAAEVIGLPTRASLQFRWAAHGMVGSSCASFELATGLILRLLALPMGESETQIRALFN